jgi:NAD(P)H-dependent glutamate synthase small subunit
VVETGSAREVHHFAVLAGYGAEAIHPYVALETVAAHAPAGMTPEAATANYVRALGKGLSKVMSKMGVSTYMSYCGSQLFEAVGLDQRFVEQYFRGTASQVGGIDVFGVADEALRLHRAAFGDDPSLAASLDAGGEYAWRQAGDAHAWSPDVIAALQHSTRSGEWTSFEAFSRMVNDQSRELKTLRGLLDFHTDPARAIPLDDVEPASEIVRRFATGAMSLGAISTEAHTTLAIAMNRIGGKSNTGEGGEDPARYRAEHATGDTVSARLGAGVVEVDLPLRADDSLRSRIKQVASGRFGVTAAYLSSADQIQIKMAQGAKPGEGGQLPGGKVSPYIGYLRYSVPGVGLISPPPHHDIYSIEDLSQLIHDLKNVNPDASISVKLVSEVGVGTVAAGVTKCKADHIVIAGHDGGTGASPLSSIKHAGTPWELGLAEAQQTLVLNRLRGRVRLQADGQMKTGRDVVIAALLGADEVGFSTAPLIVEGCIMMRKCHLNTCPVGVATQDPVLRRKFTGQPEHVVNYFFFVAEEARRIMATLGVRRFEDLVGRTDLLEVRTAAEHWKAAGLDLHRLLAAAPRDAQVARSHRETQDHGLERALDQTLIARCRPALERGETVQFMESVRNVHRSVGAMLSGALVRQHPDGLRDHSIFMQLEGNGGQSFGAFLAQGITLYLIGDANDYTGKGLSGGRIAVRPSIEFRGDAARNLIVGNTVLYGATSGEAFFRGVAGERFAVRLSGASAVVEGTGDHGCEYMTGGTVVVLGRTGRNFAAGMSGGIAYVYDEDGRFHERCNPAMVSLGPVLSATDQERTGSASGRHRGETDERILRSLIEAHHKWTGSLRAREILDDWDAARGRFVKVFPKEYERVLADADATHAAEQRRQGEARSRIFAFLDQPRVEPPYAPVPERLTHWREFVAELDAEQVAAQSARCMDGGTPFCNSGCPVHNVIPDFNDLVCREQWERASEVLHATNNFPEFTGRVCPAPCEASCTLAVNSDAVGIKSIEQAIADRAWNEGWIAPQPSAHRTGRTVAIVGSGPAGLAAAQQLARAGHDVTVFERHDRLGGLLRYGIPDFKLEKHRIDRRIDQLRAEGGTFQTGVWVGEPSAATADGAASHIAPSRLLEEFDAVLLAVGAEQGRDLPVPGRALAGVHFAMELLPQANRAVAGDTLVETITAQGKHVVVIGGGDTGSDCVGTSNRQGAASVTQFELLPAPPRADEAPSVRPHWPRVLRTSSSHEEGCRREFAIATKAFLADDSGTRVRAVRTVRVEWRDGAMRELPGTEQDFPADLVLLAAGFTGPMPTLLEAFGVETDAAGNARAADDDHRGYQTSAPKVFAAGDVRRGQSLIVWAIREGRQAARAIDGFLTGSSALPR